MSPVPSSKIRLYRVCILVVGAAFSCFVPRTLNVATKKHYVERSVPAFFQHPTLLCPCEYSVPSFDLSSSKHSTRIIGNALLLLMTLGKISQPQNTRPYIVTTVLVLPRHRLVLCLSDHRCFIRHFFTKSAYSQMYATQQLECK